jgi:epoxyqueuosine reductase
MTETEFRARLETLRDEQGFALAGWTRLERPLTFDLYRRWLDQGHQADMAYLEAHAADKENPRRRAPRAHACLSFAVSYLPHPEPRETPFRRSRVALYAGGGDYHHWFKDRLRRVADALAREFPDEHFECHTDSSPLLERDLAVRAGLGWFGKNTCVIHPKAGSFFLLGEILTSLAPSTDEPALPDFCGTCRRCLDACPTGALVKPRSLDARKCLSYWSIESRALPPVEIRERWGDWLFGCDICQSVCPWNEKVFGKSRLEGAPLRAHDATGEAELVDELRWLLTSSGKTIEKAIRGTALSRAGSFGLRRNALLVIAGRRLTALLPEVERWRDDDRLGDLARWTHTKLIE